MVTLPHTPATPTDLLAAALAQLPRPAALLAASQWCVETAGGRSMYGWNCGNLTCGAAPSYPCGNNPLVTSSQLHFSNFTDLNQGVTAYLAFLKSRGAMPALLSGDLQTFADKLSALGYAGPMAASQYVSSFSPWLAKLSALPPPPPPPINPPSSSGTGWIASALLLGGAGAIAGYLYEEFKG